MKRFLWLLLFLCGYAAASAQLNGVLVLKRNSKTIQRYYEGKQFTFINSDDQPETGTIPRVVRDTVYLLFYEQGHSVNAWGIQGIDTLNAIPLAYSLKDIKTVIRYRTKLNYAADGAVLMIAGGGVLVLGVVNGIHFQQPAKDWLSSGNIWAALGLTGFGYWLTRQSERHYHLGKTYHLEYYGFTTPK